MKQVVIYTSASCPFCTKALHLLSSKSSRVQNISVDNNPELRQKMAIKTGRRTVPQIWIEDHHIGGCDDLYSLNATGQLDALLEH